MQLHSEMWKNAPRRLRFWKQWARNVLLFSSENTVLHCCLIALYFLSGQVNLWSSVSQSGQWKESRTRVEPRGECCGVRWEGGRAAIHTTCNTPLPLVWQRRCPKFKGQRHLRSGLYMIVSLHFYRWGDQLEFDHNDEDIAVPVICSSLLQRIRLRS